MKIAAKVTVIFSAIIALSVSALADVTINSPANNTEVSSPFKLSASSATCSSKGVVSMGYSFDGSSDTTVVKDQSIDTTVSASAGAHTLHVKSWAPNGRSCVTDVKITVKAGASSADSASSSDSADSTVPSDAKSVGNIESLSGWQGTHDTGGQGSSSGYTDKVTSPSMSGSSRRFVTSFQNGGDERYSVVFSDNVNAKNFFYDTWVYVTNSVSKLGNLEFDINQVMANGNTALIGVQCDGYTGNWAYNVNQGSASSPRPHWQSVSGTTCNPRTWTPNKWHHVQASISRDDSGNITYHSVWIDGVETKLNKTAFCGADLGWDPVINTQFQVDGMGSSGQVTAYVDNLSISMW